MGELGGILAMNDVLSTGSEAEVTRSPTIGIEVYTGYTMGQTLMSQTISPRLSTLARRLCGRTCGPHCETHRSDQC